MEKLDGRKLSRRTKEEIRIRAVQRVQEGESPELIIHALGFSRACIYNWLARYRAGGWHALESGKGSGRPKKLSGSQIAWLYRTIRDKSPLQLKFSFALWTRPMIANALDKKFGIKLSQWSVGRLLRQLGFSCQKPLYRAYQQNPEAVAQWKEEVFPEIKKRAKEIGAAIFFEDESGVRSDFHSGKTWALKGQTPVVSSTGARFGLNMISAISARGQMRFMVVEGTVHGEQICDFLCRLMHGIEDPVLLIWDGHPTHKSKEVQECIDSFNGQLEVFLLPSYSPELNPVEQVWNNVKSHGVGRKALFGPDQLKAAVMASLRRVQKIHKIVLSFFQHPDCSYILDNV
jgi:transposase